MFHNFFMVKSPIFTGWSKYQVPHPDVPPWARDFAALAELNQADGRIGETKGKKPDEVSINGSIPQIDGLFHGKSHENPIKMDENIYDKIGVALF